MKAVQVGILAALLLCAGLLYKVYRGQQAAPAPAAPAAAAAPPPNAPAITAPVPVAEPAPAVEPPAPKPVKRTPVVVRKPSPSRKQTKPQPIETAAAAPAPQPDVAPPATAPNSEPKPEAKPAPEPTRAALTPPSGTETAPPPVRTPQTVTIPAGTPVMVRLQEALSSEKNAAGDAFAATLDEPLVVDGLAIAERGARVRGKVLEVVRAGRVRGVASLNLHLTRLHTSDGQDVEIATDALNREGPTSKGDDAKKVGIGAALGAAIGAIAGGGKGAAIGAGVGGAAGAGTVAVTRGKPAELPVETRLTFRIQQPVTITERIP
jgi:hypothetical protein